MFSTEGVWRRVLTAAGITAWAAACGGATESVECQGVAAQGFTSSALTSSGSTALSRDDALLYAADSDNGILTVISTATSTQIAQVPVGLLPERVLVGADDVIYVSNRGSRSVSVIRRGTWSEADRLSVGVEPVGLGLSADNGTLYVVNSASTTDPAVGSVMAFDTCRHQQQWELQVGEEPRGIAVLAGGLAVVSLYKQGDMALVDLTQPAVVQAGTSLYAQLNARALAADAVFPQFETLHARGMVEVVAGSDGHHAYATTLFSSEGLLPALTEGGSGGTGQGGGGAYGGGTCGGGNTPPPVDGGGGVGNDAGGGGQDSGIVPDQAVVPPAGPVVVAGTVTFAAFEGSGLTPQVDDLADRQGFSQDGSHPPTLLDPCGNSQFQEPVALAVSPDGTTMWVVNHGTDNVAVVPMDSLGTANPVDFGTPTTLTAVSVGAGPTGIALRRDGTLAYVHNAFDHTVLALDTTALTPVGNVIPVAEDVLPAAVTAGRRLFFSATNPDVTDPTISVSCASCHLEGREDGHVWHFTDGSRQTPQLAGRSLGSTAPYHWNGTLPTLSNFMDLTIQQRMGGLGLTADEETSLEAFLEAAPAPDNPFRGAALTAQQAHGAQLFAASQCGTCHAGQTMTNDGFADVGTMVLDGPVPDDPTTLPNGFNVPSLLGVSRSAPYLHDGSAATLEERLRRNQSANLHGQTANLSDADIADLVSYLKTL
jgi:YVTN family beta-propeller protein